MTTGEPDAGDGAATATATATASRAESQRSRATAIALIAILLLAAALRLNDLEHNPPSLFEDELAGAVSAWSIVTTGHDVGAATNLPFLTTRLELKMPLYGFSTVPFQAVLGPSALAVRLPAVLFGTAATALLFWVTRVIGRRRVEALAAAAVFATAPWAVHLGRVGWEPAAVLPFTIGGAALLVSGLWHDRPWRVVAAAAVLAAGAYAYQPALLQHVLLAVVLTLISARRLNRRLVLALAGGAVVALVLLVPYLLAFLNPLFAQRTVAVSAFKDGLTPEAFSLVWRNYWAQWDPVYLFFEPGYQPRNGPGMGVLMPILIPVLLVGLVRLVRRLDAPSLVVLGWLAIGPLAAAVTTDTVPHFLRGLFALPPLCLVAARALEPVGARIASLAVSKDRTDRGRAALGTAGLATIGALLVAFTFAPYWVRYPQESAGQWGFGQAAAMQLVRDRVPVGETVCIDTATISYWTYEQFIAWYLPDRPGVVERWDGEGCDRPGAWILAREETEVPDGLEEVARVGPPDAAHEAILWRVPGG